MSQHIAELEDLLPVLSDKVLEALHKKTVEEANRLEQEIKERKQKGGTTEMWGCGECDKNHKDPQVIIDHLMNDHGYPEEDACLSTGKVFI